MYKTVWGKTETETENCCGKRNEWKIYLKLLNETKDKISTRGRERGNT